MPDLAGRFAAGGPAAGGHPHWDQDEVHDVYRGWRRVTDAYAGERVFVGEVWLHTPEQARPLRAPGRAAHGVQLPLPAGAVGRRGDARGDRRRASTPSSRSAPRRRGCCRTTTSSATSPATAAGELGTAAGPGGGAADARPARRRLRVPGRGARPGRGRRPARRAAPGPDVPPHRRASVTGRDGCRVPIPWSGDGAAVRLRARARPAWLPQPAEWARADGRAPGRTTRRRCWRCTAAPSACAAQLAALGDGDADVARRRRRRCWRSAASPGSPASSTSATTPLAIPDELLRDGEVLLASDPLGEDGRIPGATAVWLLAARLDRTSRSGRTRAVRRSGRPGPSRTVRRRSGQAGDVVGLGAVGLGAEEGVDDLPTPWPPTSGAGRGPARWRRSSGGRRGPSRRRCTAQHARRRPCWRRSTRRCRSSTTRRPGRRGRRPRPRPTSRPTSGHGSPWPPSTTS